MSSKSETGNDKNIANFEVLISSCTSYGPAYNPAQTALKLPQLINLSNKAIVAQEAVKVLEAAESKDTNTRELLFDDLKKLSTKILSAMKASGASKLTINDVKTINRKLQGIRASDTTKAVKKDPLSDEVLVDNTISTSQQSFDLLIGNFTRLIAIISTEPLYKPNEVELQVATLKTHLTNLKTANTIAVNAKIATKKAAIARDKILYFPVTGLKDIALTVKDYVKSVFGATSKEYKQIRKLQFRGLYKR